jgi:putative flippase GtrA
VPASHPGNGVADATPTTRRRPAGLLAALAAHPAVRYLAVGGCSFLIDLGVLTLCYTVLGTTLWFGTTAGFWVSFFFNFFIQRRFSFASSQAVGASFWRYGVLLAVNTVVTVVVVELFERTGMGFTTGKVVVTVAQTVWNYLAYRLWIFPPGRTENAATDAAPRA